jgi:hypothetical protein
MEREKDRVHSARRIISPQSTNNHLKRSHAVRASLKLLGPRKWRPPSKSLNTSDSEVSIKTKKTISPTGKIKRDAKDFLIDLFGKEMSENVKSKLEKQLKFNTNNNTRNGEYQRFVEDQFDTVSNGVAINVPRKAATLLQIPTTPYTSTSKQPPVEAIYENINYSANSHKNNNYNNLKSSREIHRQNYFNQINHNQGNGEKYCCLQRTVSMIDEHQTRTATIRKGSVWANSNLSKENI